MIYTPVGVKSCPDSSTQ